MPEPAPLSPFDRLQIEAAARGHTNALREWPSLVAALTRAGHPPADLGADATTVRELCRAILRAS